MPRLRLGRTDVELIGATLAIKLALLVGGVVVYVLARDSLPDPIYSTTHSPGVFLNLVSGCAYELKLWIGASALAKTIKIRHRDPIPGVTLVDVPSAACAAAAGS